MAVDTSDILKKLIDITNPPVSAPVSPSREPEPPTVHWSAGAGLARFLGEIKAWKPSDTCAALAMR
jgi:hypothetical protein